MVVLVLIGLLASVVTLNVRGYMTKGRQEAARGEVATICQAVETFYTLSGRYPTSEEGIAILTRRSEQLSEPLLKQVPQDPWGRPYQYVQPGRSEPYEVVCLGADGREGGSGADADIASGNLRAQPASGGP
jgi:general secretion pathway protein G